eukprot:CAMPEP_0171256368 /NCGR_PEP_ID=MMETSP0790-20130122/53263_1 /TAXON_ID=2925 /ORGANISM="Alexandrium catenella, Strain OF101" /LENGTH=151 /DNA_ID=CAMNT_0011724383 /DNA_START=27 /DNA_END=479 /DNA_ORIENTATION=+
MALLAAALSGALLLPSSAVIHGSQRPAHAWKEHPDWKEHGIPARREHEHGAPESVASMAKSGTGSFIPGTVVPLPADYEDYTRGRTPWRLFEGEAPGNRFRADPAGPGLPTFDPVERDSSKEVFMDASPKDWVAAKCAPGGDATGHYIYNV